MIIIGFSFLCEMIKLGHIVSKKSKSKLQPVANGIKLSRLPQKEEIEKVFP